MSAHPNCVRCKKPLPPAPKEASSVRERWPDFPFCSERCRLIDLGVWFDEGYRIPGPSLEGSLLDPDVIDLDPDLE
jgi:endogenous inhibitor of DNA gyrase (YacG/DUF329 family)